MRAPHVLCALPAARHFNAHLTSTYTHMQRNPKASAPDAKQQHKQTISDDAHTGNNNSPYAANRIAEQLNQPEFHYIIIMFMSIIHGAKKEKRRRPPVSKI